jgi:hypothetical protein
MFASVALWTTSGLCAVVSHLRKQLHQELFDAVPLLRGPALRTVPEGFPGGRVIRLQEPLFRVPQRDILQEEAIAVVGLLWGGQRTGPHPPGRAIAVTHQGLDGLEGPHRTEGPVRHQLIKHQGLMSLDSARGQPLPDRETG